MNPEISNKLKTCVDYVRSVTSFVPKIAVVLGSGLGSFADGIESPIIIDYKDINGFPTSTVVGHAGRFVMGYVHGVPIIAMQGRVHYYEGYPMSDVVLPIRLMKMLGADTLILTNASGAINAEYNAGDFMVITKHISLFVPNPLIGGNVDELGTRFPDMTQIYDTKLCEIIDTAADKLGYGSLRHGTYVQLTGPSYESPAEIVMLRTVGADAVGMSTVCEAIAARHAGMRICGVSCIANMAAGTTSGILTHEEVFAVMTQCGEKLKALLFQTIADIGA